MWGSLWSSGDTFSYGQDDQVHVAHRYCGVSVLGNSQKPSGHGHQQLPLCDTTWAGGLDEMTSRSPFQSQLFSDI